MGTVFGPKEAEANFLYSLLGNPVSADYGFGNGNNLQNMTILQANLASSPVLQNTGNTPLGGNIVSNTALDANPGINSPAGSALGVPEGDPTDQISVYVVRSGDSLSQIAEMFDVSVNTILWANDMKKGDKISPGDILLMLPVSGISHKVAKGETLKSISDKYQADSVEVARYNGIAEDSKLTVGEELIIPDGTKKEENDKPVKNLAESTEKDKKYYESHPAKNLSGYYIHPVPGSVKTQGLHDKYGIDYGAKTGTPIRASASGTVVLARYGYNGGYGNLVIIKHPNGTQTFYAHQSKINTSTGAHVNQGQVIGYIGSTGRSTGPHLHFEVRGARNPGVDESWAR